MSTSHLATGALSLVIPALVMLMYLYARPHLALPRASGTPSANQAQELSEAAALRAIREALTEVKFRVEEHGRQIEKQLELTRADAAQHQFDIERAVRLLVESARNDAKEEAAKLVDAAKAEAEQEGAKIVAAAKVRAELELLGAREALRDQVAALAVKGAEAILKREVNQSLHADILEEIKSKL